MNLKRKRKSKIDKAWHQYNRPKKLVINSRRLVKTIGLTQTVILMSVALFVLGIISSLLTTIKLKTSQNPFRLLNSGDWILTTLNILITGFLILFVILFARKRGKLLKHIVGNIALWGLSISVAFFLIELSLLPFWKLTSKNLLVMLNIVSWQYLLVGVLLIVFSVLALYLNYEMIKKNSWNLFFVMAPYIITIGYVYRCYLKWNNFISLDSYDTKLLFAMLVRMSYGTNEIGVVTLDNLLTPFNFLMMVAVLVILLIGGMNLVWKAKKATEGRLEQKFKID